MLKPSEMSVHFSRAVAEQLPRYLDREAFAVVEGAVPETQALLAQRWDHIFFTGSGRVGRIVMQAAAPSLTRVTLELGGKSPVLVDSRFHDLRLAARRVMWCAGEPIPVCAPRAPRPAPSRRGVAGARC